jgi:hypothetical protein
MAYKDAQDCSYEFVTNSGQDAPALLGLGRLPFGMFSPCHHSERQFNGGTIGWAPIQFFDTLNGFSIGGLKTYGCGIGLFLSHVPSIALDK